MENCKPIVVGENIITDYMINTDGDVYSKLSGKYLNQEISKSGYHRVVLYVDKTPIKKSVHRLVATAFIPNPGNLPQVNHKDGNKSNNSVTNLEWITPSDNELHAYRLGLKVSKYGDESHYAKYDRKDVIEACKMMELGKYTLRDISDATKIHQAMLYLIFKRRSWVNVSNAYEVENCKRSKEKYTVDQFEEVFKHLAENKLSRYEISDLTGVKVTTIGNIINHRCVSSIEYFYDLYDISNYDSRKHQSSLDKPIIDEIVKLILSGKSNQYIRETVSGKYSVNADKVLNNANRIRKKLLAQRLSKG